MCYGRLSVGEAPACVQACPSGAITIRIASKLEIAGGIQPGDRLLPGAFDSAITKPATTYTTRRSIPANARPGDAQVLRREHAHWPLIWMLVLTQVAAGMYVSAAGIAAGSGPLFETVKGSLSVVAFVMLNLGLAVSVLHLGRPLGAWRAFLGLRTSWMSREILAFGLFAAPAAGLVVTSCWEILAGLMPALRAVERFANPGQFAVVLAVVTAVLGLLGVFCSAMIYVDTHRPFWAREFTFTKFFGTALLLGTAGTAAVLAWIGAVAGVALGGAVVAFAIVATIIRTALMGWEFLNFRQALTDSLHPNHRSAEVMWNLQRRLLDARVALFVCSTVFGLAAMNHSGVGAAMFATLSFLFTFGSQIIERYFFFTAVVAPRMPGSLVPETSAHA
jgi:DMSO reductase anchor subunit